MKSYASVIEEIKIENYNRFNKENNIPKKNQFEEIISNYLEKIFETKFGNRFEFITEKAKKISTRAINYLKGDYNIGIDDYLFEEIDGIAENFSNMFAYSNALELFDLLNDSDIDKVSDIVVDGSLSIGSIPCSDESREQAEKRYKNSDSKFKKFFENSLNNILNVNKKVANIIAHISGMDKEESNEFNTNIFGKFVGGIGYELLSGTLMSKRKYTPIRNSSSIQKQIKEEGLLHFTAPQNIEKILESGKIKKSDILTSDMTLPKSFFFAGVPKFEDLLINVPAYDVMTAIRIKPTEEQMEELKYRPLNDRAVVKNGDFKFDKENVEIAYFGLMYDKENKNIYLGEITKEEAQNFKVSNEVKNVYNYKTGKNSIIDNIKMNAYGFFAEYKHHQKLLKMESLVKQKGINFENIKDSELVELSDIKQAYADTQDKSVERQNIFKKIKNVLEINKNTNNKEKENDDRTI